MSITIKWDNPEQTIIRYDIEDPWTWQDLIQATLDDDVMIDSVPHQVHLIINMENTQHLPENPLRGLRNVSNVVVSRLGLIVITGENAWFKMITELFYTMYGSKVQGLQGMRWARTLAEARQIIHSQAQV